jgi:hypothetical protein
MIPKIPGVSLSGEALHTYEKIYRMIQKANAGANPVDIQRATLAQMQSLGFVLVRGRNGTASIKRLTPQMLAQAQQAATQQAAAQQQMQQRRPPGGGMGGALWPRSAGF